MKLPHFAAFMLIFFSAIVWPNDATPPTEFEVFATNPDVTTTVSEAVGVLRSDDSIVTVSALVCESRSDPDQVMEGALFRMENNSGFDEVYLSKHRLVDLHRELTWISEGVADLQANRDTPYRTHGSGDCWAPENPKRILCPNYSIGPSMTVFSLHALGDSGYDFPNKDPSEFLELVKRAIFVLDNDK